MDIDTLPEGPITDYIRFLESQLYDLSLELAELADEVGSKRQQNRELNKHRNIVESLLLELYKLPSTELLYWAGRKVRSYTDDKKGDAAAAAVILYYVLYSHSSSASLSKLEDIYGYSRVHIQSRFNRVDAIPKHHAIRTIVERQFLNRIGLADEPVTECWPENGGALHEYKEQCRAEGITYRRSMHDDSKTTVRAES